MDLRQWRENPVKQEQKKKIELKADQIKRATEIYFKWQSEGTNGTKYAEPEQYRSVGLAELEKNDYSLVPSQYLKFVDRDSKIDYHEVLTKTVSTVSDLLSRQEKNDKILRKALKQLGYECEK
jgi:type I restriction enzyme M protein